MMSTLHGIRTKCQNEHMCVERKQQTEGQHPPQDTIMPPLHIFHPHAIPLRTKSTGLACLYLVSALHWIVEEEQAMLPDPLRRKRADCTLLNPQKDTTHTSGHKRTQIDHPAPPMVPTGQQLTTYLAVEWTAIQAIESARGCSCCCCLDLEREGEIKRGPHQSGEVRRCPMSACRDTRAAELLLLANVSGHEL